MRRGLACALPEQIPRGGEYGPVITLAKNLSRIGNGAAILALVFMFGHIILEITLRNLFHTSTFVLDEFVGHAVSALTFLALGEALRTGTLIRVSLLHDSVPDSAKRVLEMFAMASALSVGSFALWFVGVSVLRQFERGTTSASIAQIPLWIPEALVLFGLAIFVLQALAGLIGLIFRTPQSEETV
ncbi:TRAP transporter small permease [Roseibacterium beibuensis]|uniref:TRAP transporter small permease protein n=1 Tax=[Roseibacterium] beibuensis TaxID=1193142 RepID=A0ABP9KUC8_9RHOB